MAYITGTSRFEVLYGTRGNDVIDSRGGNDLMIDNYTSNDTYLFNYGYYQPNITDLGGYDTIILGAGIRASDIKFYLTRGGYLMPRIKDTNDKPEVTKWTDPKYRIELWKFQDGTVLTADQITKMIDYNTRVLVGTERSDTMRVGQGNNLVYLMQGDDTFYANGGNNIVEASSGNDKLYFYSYGNDEIYMSSGVDYVENRGGNDRYIYNSSDGPDTIYDMAGNDTVKFGRFINGYNLLFNRSGSDLVVNFRYKTNDQLTIRNWFTSSNNKIETFELWDGSRISFSEVDRRVGGSSTFAAKSLALAADIQVASEFSSDIKLTPTIVGTDRYDYITGKNGDEVYDLKKGNDRVMDYAGNDVYLFNKGDGRDNITDQAGNDTIAFGYGISAKDLSFTKDPFNSENLIISINNTDDNININKWARDANYQIEKIQFADGSYLTNADINEIIQSMTAYSATAQSQAEVVSSMTTQQELLTLVSQ